MYKDALGTEIQIGNVIAVSRYGRRSRVDTGVVFKIEIKPTSYWVKFINSWGSEQRAQLAKGVNDNIVVVDPRRIDESVFKKAKRTLIGQGVFPVNYTIGDSIGAKVEETEKAKTKTTKVEPTKSEISESLLDSLGPPTSL